MNLGTQITESIDLFSVPKSKEEINENIKKYGIKCVPKVSPEGQAYSEISGTYAGMVCFLSEILDKRVVEVMISIGSERFWYYGDKF